MQTTVFLILPSFLRRMYPPGSFRNFSAFGTRPTASAKRMIPTSPPLSGIAPYSDETTKQSVPARTRRAPPSDCKPSRHRTGFRRSLRSRGHRARHRPARQSATQPAGVCPIDYSPAGKPFRLRSFFGTSRPASAAAALPRTPSAERHRTTNGKTGHRPDNAPSDRKGGQCIRWRTASNSRTAAAADTFSDSMEPITGTASCTSHSLSTSFDMPLSSLPMTMTVGLLRSAS